MTPTTDHQPEIKVSVIIPAYNEEKLIGRCLEALKQQTWPADQFEVIVVDNDSADATAQIATGSGAKVVHYSEAHTVGAVRNAGVAQAKGELLAFVDADTQPTPTWLEDIVKAFADAKVMALGGVGLPAGGNLIDRFFFACYDLFCIVNQWFGVILVAGFNMAARHSAYTQVKGFDPSLKSAEDIDLLNKIRHRYGSRSVKYFPGIKVYTSTRKMKDPVTMIRYTRDGAINYFNIVFRRQSKGRTMINVR